LAGVQASILTPPGDHVLQQWLEKNVGMHRLNRSGLIQALADLGRDGEVERAEIIVELRQLAGAQDGGGDSRLRGHPIQGDLGGGLSELGRSGRERIHDAPVALAEFVEHRMGLGFLQASITRSAVALPLILARKQPGAQRTPRADRDSQFLRRRDMLALDVALDERILQLQRGDAVLAFLLRQSLRAGDVPGRGIGKAVVPDFAGADQIVQSGHYFFDRRHPVPGMQPV